MTKYIINENNFLMYHYTDKNGSQNSFKISNYSLRGLFILLEILNTKNRHKLIEKVVL